MLFVHHQFQIADSFSLFFNDGIELAELNRGHVESCRLIPVNFPVLLEVLSFRANREEERPLVAFATVLQLQAPPLGATVSCDC